TPDDIITLNQCVVAATGEPFGLLFSDLVESALGRLQSHWAYQDEDDALSLAVTLLFALARNHPFEQGNKRTAFEAAIIFLEANGYGLSDDLPDSEELARLITAAIAHERDEADVEAALRPYVISLEEEGIQAN
ncbi:MAG: type II toxin-antitoxin system death-on-curing family toxin, partial [Terracidiphilus sp.]|nr:type II toxin-antitoxin system death-on-curing family toxin [Terracidiphilus sp.]